MNGVFALSAFILVASATAGTGTTYTFTGTGGDIPDASGGMPGRIESTINLGLGPNATIIEIEIRLNDLWHPWMGDLKINLYDPAHPPINPMSDPWDILCRPGQIDGAGFGDNSNFNGDYNFADFGGDFLLGQGTDFDQPSGTYAPLVAFSSLNGLNASGDWTLVIEDFAAGDVGGFDSWTLRVTVIPTPGAAALMGLAGVAGLRRRR
jgi:uncharacterized protein (TIGR03382 family)